MCSNYRTIYKPLPHLLSSVANDHLLVCTVVTGSVGHRCDGLVCDQRGLRLLAVLGHPARTIRRCEGKTINTHPFATWPKIVKRLYLSSRYPVIMGKNMHITFSDCGGHYVRYGNRAARLHGRNHWESHAGRRGAGRVGCRRLCCIQGEWMLNKLCCCFGTTNLCNLFNLALSEKRPTDRILKFIDIK